MPSWGGLLLCSSLALGFYFLLGLVLALRFSPIGTASLLAPITGWAVHSAAALPVLFLAGMSRASVAFVFIVPLVGSLAVLYRSRGIVAARRPSLILLIALISALVLSLLVALGAWPKVSGDSVTFAAPIFDHSKIAIIDEIARLGLPPGNPFFGGREAGPWLSYYYLWHFTATEWALLLGVSSWTADVALTWFTAFSSLCLLTGLAIWFGGRASAALWVVALAATASLRPLINAVIDPVAAKDVIGEQSGFGAWFFQTTWAPQHAASATAAVLAAFVMARLSEAPRAITCVLLGLMLAATFESSTWIGGIVLPLSAIAIAMFMIEQTERSNRLRLLLHFGATGALALLLVSPFLADQFIAASMRGGGVPIAIEPYAVLGQTAGFARDAANLVAYWTVFLPVEFPAFFATGLILLYWLRTQPNRDRATLLALTVLLFAGLLASWLLRSTLADNNDLGWRAVLPAVMVLIVFAAVGLSHLQEKRRTAAFAAAIVLVLLGLPESIKLIRDNILGDPRTSSNAFADSAVLWQAVRQHSAPGERVANNPQSFNRMTPWPANMSWALLSDRRSCYAGGAFTRPFTGISPGREKLIEAQFARVFEGTADADDIAQLASQYNCSVIVLTPEDGAWSRDPVVASSYYRAVESTSRWRIYKLVNLAGNEGR